ncbi:MAG: alkaline phosphatase [Bacilli bacterium]|nr:alkaline phosphatase [Bacilli bacterium]
MQGVEDLIEENILSVITHYGYIGIFGSLALGILGLPVPDEILMTFSGYLISKGELQYFPTLLISVLGSLLGMSVSYLIGHKFGYPLLVKHGAKIHITKEKLEHAEQWFKRFGKFAVTIGYFIPGVRHLTAYFAGISKWPSRTFFLYAAPGAVIWALTFNTLGIVVGEHWREVTETIHRYLLLALFVVIAAVAAIWGIKWFGKLRIKVK